MRFIASTRLIRLMVAGILGGVLLMTLGLVIYESLQAHRMVLVQQQQTLDSKLEKYAQRMKHEAETLQENLLYRFNQAEVRLREMSQEQVDIAHTTATSIYTAVRGQLSEQQIKKLIIETLRKVSFFQGRGYVFITSMEGESILLPTNPELEGTSLMDQRDVDGIYITRELIKTVSNPTKKGFARYSWYEPNQPEVMAEKITYARQFEPYDWLIGSGDYVYQMEDQIRKEVLTRIKSLKLPSDGYFIVMDERGRLLTDTSSAKDVGRLPAEFTDPHQQRVVQALLATAKQGGGVIEYSWRRPGYEGLHSKLGFVTRVPETGWVLVASGYRDAVLADYEPPASWFASFIEKFIVLVWPLLVIGLITLFFALLYARWLGRLLNHYQHNINEQQDRLQTLAEIDPLTDLPNRWLMSKALKQAMNEALQKNHKLALIVIDIDRFKNINDSLGHALGDKVLQEVGRRMKTCNEKEFFVARMGGDEFVLLVDSYGSNEQLATFAQNLLKEICKPILIEKNQLVVTASIGIALYPEQGVNQDTLLRHADIAMYQAKARGRNCYCFYHKAMGELVIDRLQLENDLRKALKEEKELFILYQPQWSLDTGKIVGCEALIRWNHPIRGLIQPLEFISLAEETGLILELGDWVLDHALAQARAWQDQGLPTISMAVNLSTAQLNTNLPNQVEKLLKSYNLPAGLLELEVTETLLMTAPEEATAIITQLKDTGIRIALDDFGTGYSSLAYLSRLPLNVLKIDKSFVDGLPSRQDDVVITHLIIHMAAQLGITTLAEGVETQEQLDFLKTAGCHLIQGYLKARPLPPEELAVLLGKS